MTSDGRGHIQDEQEEEEPEPEPERTSTKPVFVPPEPEKMLSKKELKAKEMEELNNVFAELGIDLDAKKVRAGPPDTRRATRARASHALARVHSRLSPGAHRPGAPFRVSPTAGARRA